MLERCHHFGGLSKRDCAIALRIAHAEAVKTASGQTQASTRGNAWPDSLDTVTAGVHVGAIGQSNTGHPCRSGRVLSVELIGDFTTVVSPPPVLACQPTPDYSVHAVDLDVDHASGQICRIGARTGTVSARSDATVIYHR